MARPIALDLPPSLMAAAEQLPQPVDYFAGWKAKFFGSLDHVLVFLRSDKASLQRKTVESNQHHRYVLVVCLRTSGVVKIDHRSLPLSPGQAVLVLPYQFHNYLGLEAADLRWLFITFESSRPGAFESFRVRRLDLHTAQFQRLERLLAPATRRSFQGKGDLLLAELAGLLAELRASLPEGATRPRSVPAPSRAGHLIDRVHGELERHPGAAPSIPHLSRKLGLSESRLRTVFRGETGISLGAYLRQHRVHQALSRMHQPGLALYQVAEQCGYRSSAAFSRSFKQLVGLSPRQYRQKHLARRRPTNI